LVFYVATLAPTVLWGDDAFLQRAAVSGALPNDGGGHWLHFWLARLFVRLPWGDAAYRVNLLSAVAAALTIPLVYGIGRALHLSYAAAAAGALSLAVAHTFWTHAVRAEVYSLFLLLTALSLWLWFSWRPERPGYSYAAAFLGGPLLLAHQMGLLLWPALAVLLWQRRRWPARRQQVLMLVAFLSGWTFAGWVIHYQVGEDTVLKSLAVYFTRSGTDFSGSLFDFSPGHLPGDMGYWLVMLVLQFAGPAVLLGFWGLAGRWRDPSARLLMVFYGTAVLFALSYRVNDRYVFFLPGYLAFALFVGYGWQALGEKRPELARLAWPLLVIVPVLTYGLLPLLMSGLNIPLAGVRQLPGREPLSFFLWPAKNGYMGAAEYGRLALDSLPPDSVLIGDHTPIETLHYLQVVEGIRPDVRLVKIQAGSPLPASLQAGGGPGPFFLADNNPAYYNLTSLPGAVVHPVGVVYRLKLSDG
jgi:hypothetical protein